MLTEIKNLSGHHYRIKFDVKCNRVACNDPVIHSKQAEEITILTLKTGSGLYMVHVLVYFSNSNMYVQQRVYITTNDILGK